MLRKADYTLDNSTIAGGPVEYQLAKRTGVAPKAVSIADYAAESLELLTETLGRLDAILVNVRGMEEGAATNGIEKSPERYVLSDIRGLRDKALIARNSVIELSGVLGY